MDRLRQSWKWYLAILVVVIIVILLLNSLNVLVYSGPLRVGVVPTITVYSGKLWLMLLLPFLVGLVVGIFVGARFQRAPRPAPAPRP